MILHPFDPSSSKFRLLLLSVHAVLSLVLSPTGLVTLPNVTIRETGICVCSRQGLWGAWEPLLWAGLGERMGFWLGSEPELSPVGQADLMHPLVLLMDQSRSSGRSLL